MQPLLHQIGSLTTRTEPRFGATARAWATQFVDANITDYKLVEYVIDGLQNGFDTGIDEKSNPVTCSKNHNVDVTSQIAIANDIIKGHSKGYLLGPFNKHDPRVANVVISKLGTVTKHGKIRVINDYKYGYKNGNSVNDFVNPAFKTVQYISTRERIQFLHDIGPNAWIWVADMQDAFKSVPIRPSQRRYFGFCFYGYVFVFASLSFGLASACRIYSCFAEAIRSIAVHKHPKLFKSKLRDLLQNYLDDFWGGHPNK